MSASEQQTASELIINSVRDTVAARYAEDLEAALLVGSFSRGEEMFVREQDTVTFLSDIEFLFVVPEAAFEKFKGLGCSQALQAALKQAGWNIEVSVGITTRQHLRKYKPYIFTVETRKYGKVLWGDADILRFVPAYTEQDISRLDALILLNNRIVEQLILLNTIETETQGASFLIDKGYVQVVNSLLAFEKRYKCLYPEKKYELIQLNVSGPDVFRQSGLDITRCLDALERVIQRESVPVSRSEMMDQWRQLRVLFQNVWLYEISRLLNYEDLDLARGLKYILSIPDLMSCVRGWGKVWLKKAGQIFGAGDIVSKFCLTSPQFLIYRDAARLYFSDGSTRQERLDVIDKWQRIVK